MYNYKQMNNKPKGDRAARLRQRKFELLKRLKIPGEALPGSLSHTTRRCGKSNCHCASGEGHGVWFLTYMDKGEKRVAHIPEELIEEVQKRVDAGREFKEGLAEVLTANAELLTLWRRQRR